MTSLGHDWPALSPKVNAGTKSWHPEATFRLFNREQGRQFSLVLELGDSLCIVDGKDLRLEHSTPQGAECVVVTHPDGAYCRVEYEAKFESSDDESKAKWVADIHPYVGSAMPYDGMFMASNMVAHIQSTRENRRKRSERRSELFSKVIALCVVVGVAFVLGALVYIFVR